MRILSKKMNVLTSVTRNFLRSACLGLVVTTLVACSDGSGSGGEPLADVVTEDTDIVVRNAVRSVSSKVGVNMNSIEATADNSTAVSALVDDEDTPNTSVEEITSVPPFSDDEAFGHEQTLRDIIRPTLEGGNAVRTRTGNAIAIDPDEQYVCQQWLANDLIDERDVQDCAELFGDLTVTIDANTDDSGKLTYKYSGQNLLIINYGPDSGSFELFLPAVKLVLQQADVIAGEQSTVPEVVEGAIVLSASVINSAFGEESGSMSMAVSQPIRIESAEESISLQIGSSSAFSINTDAATGDGELSIKIASMVFSLSDDIGFDRDSFITITVPDFTTNIELKESGSEVLLTNTGFGIGPMTVEVDDQLAMSLALAKTSALFDGDNPTVTILENMGLDLQIPDLHQFTGGDVPVSSTAALLLSAVAGTVLTSQDNNSTKVDSGGPFNIEYSYLDGGANAQGAESFLVGECFDETSDNEWTRVSCE